MEREPDVIRQAMHVARMASGADELDSRFHTRRIIRVRPTEVPPMRRLELSLDLVVISLFFSAVVGVFAYTLFGL